MVAVIIHTPGNLASHFLERVNYRRNHSPLQESGADILERPPPPRGGLSRILAFNILFYLCLDPADGALSRMAAPSGDSILERLGPSRNLAPDSWRRPSHLAISSWREGGISRNLAPDSWRRPKHIVSITQDGCFFVLLQQICFRLSCAMIL